MIASGQPARSEAPGCRQEGLRARFQASYHFTTSQIENDPKAVVIDPRVQFGRPCLRGTGIPTDAVQDRFLAGETIVEIAADYEVEPQQVEEAIRYERLPRAA